MNIQEHVDLKPYSSMKLGGKARFLVAATTRDEIIEAVEWAAVNNHKFRVIGEGSNIIFTDEGYHGLIIVNQLKGVDVQPRDNDYLLVAEAGEHWDSVVETAVSQSLTGIEALSAIPGTTGATPVQNVGAYGQEVSQTIEYVEVYNFRQEAFERISNLDCKFSYRDSTFKHHGRDSYIILSVAFSLKKGSLEPPLYQSLQTYLDENNISTTDPRTIRDAVVAIRTSKLPDPSVVANNGSFFKNPVVGAAQFHKLKETYPDIPGYSTNDNFKIPAGWLLETAGYKNYLHKNGMGTYEHHALVLVNYSAQKYADLEQLVREIREKVDSMFGITLEQEPEVIEP